MRVYFAPMEGVTDVLYRQVHHKHFGGVDKYFMPFISPTPSMTFSRRERLDMDPRENAGVPVVPQILCARHEQFNALAALLRDMGYTELNLNLGCPSGTVTAKGKGSGLLRDMEGLRRLLDGIFAHPLLPVSVKTRIGYEDVTEWPALLRLLREYPLSELIVHPRTRQEFYNGEPHWEVCKALEQPFIYNGDLFTAAACRALLEELPMAQGVMLGRGLVANPALAQELSGGQPLTLEALAAFHDDLYAAYLRFWPESAVVGRMHLMMKYLCGCFEGCDALRRALHKVKTAEEYERWVQRLFGECPLKRQPAFDLEILLS